MYEKTLREIPLFEDVEYSFFRAFAKKLKEQYFQKGYMVIRSNEVISQMYIIYRGKVTWNVIINIILWFFLNDQKKVKYSKLKTGFTSAKRRFQN